MRTLSKPARGHSLPPACMRACALSSACSLAHACRQAGRCMPWCAGQQAHAPVGRRMCRRRTCCCSSPSSASVMAPPASMCAMNSSGSTCSHARRTCMHTAAAQGRPGSSGTRGQRSVDASTRQPACRAQREPLARGSYKRLCRLAWAGQGKGKGRQGGCAAGRQGKGRRPQPHLERGDGERFNEGRCALLQRGAERGRSRQQNLCCLGIYLSSASLCALPRPLATHRAASTPHVGTSTHSHAYPCKRPWAGRHSFPQQGALLRDSCQHELCCRSTTRPLAGT